LSVCSISYADSRIAPPLDQLTQNFKPTQEEESAGASVLYKETKTVVSADGNSSGAVYVAIKLLDKAAVNDYGQLNVSYNSYYDSVNLDFARIISNNGEIQNLKADAVQTQTRNGDQFFDNNKQLKFTLPSLGTGSVIEYQYSFKSIKPIIKNNWTTSRYFHYFQSIPNSDWVRVDPVRVSKFQVQIPDALSLRSSSYNFSSPLRKTKTIKSTIYEWNLVNLPGIKPETRMPSFDELLPYIDLTTLDSWSQLSEWSLNQITPKIEVTPEIKKLASKLVQGTTSEQEKVKVIFNFIQENIKYVYAHVNANGFTPHSASTVLSNHYGDCKDQAILMISLLKSLGIKAYPALINTYRNDFDANTPIINFDHMIVHLPDINNSHWLDTSGDTGMYPGIYPSLKGKEVLIVKDSGTLIKLPEIASSHNRIVYKADYHYPAEKKELTVTITMYFKGVFDSHFRAWYKHSNDRKNELFRFVSSIYTQGKILDTQISDVNNLNVPLSITAQVKLIDSNEERLSVGENIKNLLASFTTLLSLPLPSERKYDYVYDFTYELDSTVSLSIPDKSNVIQVYKTGANYENDFFSLQHSSKKSSNYAEISSNFILKKKRIPVESYHDFYQQIEHAIKQADAILAYLKSSPSPPSKQRIQTGTDEFTNLLNKAEQALDQANYQKAKELALKGLELNNSDPKIYYILGVSSGFLDDYDSSENYLKKAEELGFQP
jgi:hypothetical protein